MVVVQEVFRLIKKLLLKGSLYAFPLMNPIGFENSSRYITVSEEDLNRSFPGDKNGSLAERMADKIFSTVLESKPNLVLDLHNDWISSIPYALVDYSKSLESIPAYKKTKQFSRMTSLISILDTDELEDTFSYNLLLRGIPALTLELGESYVINERSVECGVKSILNLLSELGMIKPFTTTFGYPVPEILRDKILKYSQQMSSTSGIVRFLAKPGFFVKKGQPLAKIYNAFGRLEETVLALNDGVILGHSDYSVAFPGAPIIAFGNI